MPSILLEEDADKSCRFCSQDENDDPGEEFEEPYACVVCGHKGTWELFHGSRGAQGGQKLT